MDVAGVVNSVRALGKQYAETGDLGSVVKLGAFRVNRWATLKVPLRISTMAQRIGERQAAVGGVQSLSDVKRLVHGPLQDSEAGARTNVMVLTNGVDDPHRTRPLMAELRMAGAKPSTASLSQLSVADDGSITIKGKSVARPDAVIARAIEPDDLAKLTTLESHGTFVMDPPGAVAVANSKAGLAELFARTNVAHPKSAVVDSIAGAKQAAAGFNNKVVIKTLYDSGSRGVELATTPDDVDRVVHDYMDADKGGATKLVVQQFHPEASGEDRRVLVMRDPDTGRHEVFAAMKRTARGGDWRANGGPAGMVYTRLPVDGSDPDLTPAEIELARRAVEVSNVDSAGADVMRTDEGPKIVEINPTPGTPERDIKLPRNEQYLPRLAAFAVRGTRGAAPTAS